MSEIIESMNWAYFMQGYIAAAVTILLCRKRKT